MQGRQANKEYLSFTGPSLGLSDSMRREGLADSFSFLFFKDCIYLFMRDTERGRDTGRGEAGSMQGARCGTQSQDPRVMTWAQGRCSTMEPPGIPKEVSFFFFFKILFIYS